MKQFILQALYKLYFMYAIQFYHRTWSEQEIQGLLSQLSDVEVKSQISEKISNETDGNRMECFIDSPGDFVSVTIPAKKVSSLHINQCMGNLIIPD